MNYTTSFTTMDTYFCGEMEEEELLELQKKIHLETDDDNEDLEVAGPLGHVAAFTFDLGVVPTAALVWERDVVSHKSDSAAALPDDFDAAPNANFAWERAAVTLEPESAAVAINSASACNESGNISSESELLADCDFPSTEQQVNFSSTAFFSDFADDNPRGIFAETARQFQCSRQTISRLWYEAMKEKKEGNVVNVDSKLKGNAGRKCKELTADVLQAVPLKHRTTIRSYASFLKVSPSLVYRMIQRGQLRSHTNSIKPKLTDAHKRQRLLWSLQHIIPRTLLTKACFDGFYNYVHMDEKWFYLNKETMRFYLLPNEEEPYRNAQNKKFIPKVMFLAAVARPVLSDAGDVIWDGKIGIFPFTEVVLAQRSSNNRVRGTPEVKAIQKITREVIRQKLITHVLPSIRAKWPSSAQKEIFIQQDNARPHILPNDCEFNEAAQLDGFNIKLVYQPPQSPDLNILDLGFFRAIQAIQHQEFPNNVEELVKVVEEAYEKFDPKVLNYTWLHLQHVMYEILRHRGHNNYRNPHNGKRKLDKAGMLEENVEVEQVDIDAAVNFLNENSVGLHEDDDDLF